MRAYCAPTLTCFAFVVRWSILPSEEGRHAARYGTIRPEPLDAQEAGVGYVPEDTAAGDSTGGEVELEEKPTAPKIGAILKQAAKCPMSMRCRTPWSSCLPGQEDRSFPMHIPSFVPRQKSEANAVSSDS